jgi:hypothetical protein
MRIRSAAALIALLDCGAAERNVPSSGTEPAIVVPQSRYNVLLSEHKLAAATLSFPSAGAVAAFP